MAGKVDDFQTLKILVDADFANEIFDEVADFKGATFRKANFEGAVFAEGADFEGATFDEVANFKGATFKKTASFSDAVFVKRVDFNDTIFLEGAYFGSAIFTGYTEFRDAKFNEVSFANATFREFCGFTGATFSRGTYFDGTIFDEEAHFHRATFADGANFALATFSKGAHFWRTTFERYTSFSKANFLGGADFKNAQFIEAYFATATFTKEAEFAEAAFTKLADFQCATFAQKADFFDATLKGEISFRSAIFSSEPPRFSGATLHEGADWHAVTWPHPPKDVLSAVRFVTAYERLKLEMDRLKKHGDELDFFARELQCRRALLGDWAPITALRIFGYTLPVRPLKIPKTTINQRYCEFFHKNLLLIPSFSIPAVTIQLCRPTGGLPIALYGLLCDYGRSYARPLGFLLATVLIGLPLFWTFTNADVGEAFGLSFANTFSVLGIRKDLIAANVLEALPGGLKVIATMQTAFGIVLLFLFGLGIKNRFRMK